MSIPRPTTPNPSGAEMKRRPSGDGGPPDHGGLPRGEGHDQQAERPADVVPGGRLQRAQQRLDEVEGVRQPEGRDARGEQHPGAVQAPAGGRQRADGHADQDEVGERVGERRRDLDRLAADVVERGLEDDRGADRGDRERGDRAVDPERGRDVAGAGAHEREDPGAGEHREEQEADVGGRRDRRRLEVVEDDRVVEVAERPREHADADQQPRRLLAPRLPGAAEAQHAREHLDDVVRVVAEDRAQLQAGDRDDLQLEARPPRRRARRRRASRHAERSGSYRCIGPPSAGL